MKEKRTTVFENGLIWFGAAVSIAEIMTGTYFAPLGFSSINDVITVLDENGEEMEIAIKDYAFKP